MKHLLSLATIVGFAMSSARADDIPRTIAKEPAYQSGSPRYCLLLFGMEAKTRVWIVIVKVIESPKPAVERKP